jgi:hypothetical protein
VPQQISAHSFCLCAIATMGLAKAHSGFDT